MEVRTNIPWADVLARSSDATDVGDVMEHIIANVRLADVSAQDLILLCRGGLFSMPSIVELREHNNGDYL